MPVVRWSPTRRLGTKFATMMRERMKMVKPIEEVDRQLCRIPLHNQDINSPVIALKERVELSDADWMVTW